MATKQSLAVALSQLNTFSQAKVELEQYATDSNIAAEVLWHAHLRGLLQEQRVIDLGAGTGILAIGAALLGAEVTCVEKDPAAVQQLKMNIAATDAALRIVEGDVASYTEPGDLVIMNPPFGTKEKHADRVFLTTAVKLAPIIYSMHKSSTKPFITAFCKENQLQITWEQEVNFPLPQSMQHHRKQREHVAVTLYCFEKHLKATE